MVCISVRVNLQNRFSIESTGNILGGGFIYNFITIVITQIGIISK